MWRLSTTPPRTSSCRGCCASRPGTTQQAWYNLVFSDRPGFIFRGYLKKLGGMLDMNDIIQRDLSFKVSGKGYSVV